MSIKLNPIHEFDNQAYLNQYPDVSSAVQAGMFSSGYEHFLIHGEAQGRTYQRTESDIELTIVVPSYNSERYLSATLLSIQLQSLKNWECIIVNDASEDRTTAIAAAFAKRDPRFRMAFHRANAGLSASRNLGIRLARAPYITFLDSDDVLFQDSLSTRLEVVKSSDPAVTAGSYCGSKHVAESYADFPNSSLQSGHLIDFVTSEGKCPFTANQPMLNVEILRQFGGFREELRQAEDWELWMRLLRHGYNFVPTGYRSVGYRSRKGSMLLSDPLHHTTTSHAIYNSSHESLPEDWIGEGPCIFAQPWLYYKKQVEFADRLISAAGMAGEINDETFATLFRLATPNFKRVVLDRIDVKNIITKSMTRSLGLAGSHDDIVEQPARQKVADLLSKIPDDGEEPETSSPPSSDNIYSLLGISPEAAHSVDVLFAPHSAYHVRHMLAVAEDLEERGVRCVFVDSTSEYRDQGVRAELQKAKRAHVSFSSLLLGRFAPRAVICMCDWDVPVQRVVRAAKHIGIPTIGIVEGVQDFDDADTGRSRRAYKTVDHVLLPGRFDEKHFPVGSPTTKVVGLARLDDLRSARRTPSADKTVIINVNFTYNVLEDRREDWLEEVVQACEQLGVRYQISQHPSDTANLNMYERSDDPLYTLLETGSCLVSRFSSVILESLAIGTPVIYHNSIDERVDKFNAPLGAFEKSQTLEELKKAISRSLDIDQHEVRSRATNFLDLHCGFDLPNPSAKNTADAIVAVIESAGEVADRSLSLAEVLRSSDHFGPYNVHSPESLKLSEQDLGFAEADRKRALVALANSDHTGVSAAELRKLIVSASIGADGNLPQLTEAETGLLAQARAIGDLERVAQSAQISIPIWRGFSASSFISYPTFPDAGKSSSFFFGGWFRFSDKNTHECVMSSSSHDMNNAQVMVRRHSNGKVQFQLSHLGVSEYVWHDLPDEAWYWVAGSFDGFRLELWIDGTIVQSKETSLDLGEDTVSSSLNIGVFTDPDGTIRDHMRGSIAQLEVRGRTFSAREIEDRYAAQRHFGSILSEGSLL